MAGSPDFTFGAKRRDLDLRVFPERDQKTRRNLNAKVSRNLPAISAPERNVSKGVADALARGIANLRGGDERARAQRASGIADAFSWLNPVEPVERAVRHGVGQLSGGPAASTADLVNLMLPAAGLAARPLARLASKALPAGAARWLGGSRAMPEIDDAVEGSFSVKPTPQQPLLAARPVPRALPAPGKQLALPNYHAPLPEYAAKPRGGQWLPSGVQEPNVLHPETGRFTTSGGIAPEHLLGDLAPQGFNAEAVAANPELAGVNAHRDWIERNLAKYIKNDFGSPEDPLRLLDEQGIRLPNDYRGEVPWSDAVRYNVDQTTFGGLVGPGAPEAEFLLQDYPWMAKQPVTDQIYGLREGALSSLGFGHLSDEIGNMARLNSGLPENFRLRPEQLSRLSVPDAVRRVHELGAWRQANAAEANAALSRNPATHVFKEYPDDPNGMHWVELKNPGEDAPAPEGWMRDGNTYYNDMEGTAGHPHPSLQEALEYEGSTMGHCVGGYCNDVAEGRSRIFSLRDAKGQPHVTVETEPDRTSWLDKVDHVPELRDAWDAAHSGRTDPDLPFDRWLQKHAPEMYARNQEVFSASPENIVQIKGKGNRAPVDDYLPYVQDFVKSGQWGEIGDLQNTGLAKLPDNRLVNQQQINEAVARLRADSAARLGGKWTPEIDDIVNRDMPSNMMSPGYLSPEGWESVKPYFEGFAHGGRVRRYLAAR